MIYGKPVDYGFAEDEAAYERARTEMVEAYFDDPLGMVVKYLEAYNKANEADLNIAMTPNVQAGPDLALEIGMAWSRIVLRARDDFVSRRKEQILEEMGM